MSAVHLVHVSQSAWEKWRESEEGKKCLKGEAMGTYLENRLWRAFMDAWQAASQQLQKMEERPHD